MLIVKPFEEVTREDMMQNFEVNVVTPLLLSQKLLPLLKLSASQNKSRTLIANISSKIASIDDNTSGGRYPYRCVLESKTWTVLLNNLFDYKQFWYHDDHQWPLIASSPHQNKQNRPEPGVQIDVCRLAAAQDPYRGRSSRLGANR